MSFYQDFLVKSPLFNSTSVVSLLNYLEPILRERVHCILEDAAAQGTPLMVFETYRSQARQQALYAQGATQLSTVGVHHYGLACDLVKNIGGSPSWKGDFSFLGKLADKYQLVWGGNWGNPGVAHGFVDLVHLQRVAVIDQPKLFAQAWYPDDQYEALA